VNHVRVLRGYNYRLLCTNQRRDVYLQYFGDATQIVVEYDDSKILLGQGPQQPRETLPLGAFEEGSNDRDWIWSFRDCFSVLSVPYHHGRNWARHISKVIPLLEQLLDLHRRGFVHGDIRCINVVVDGDGGQNRSKFPASYRFHLAEGARRARPSAAISRVDDT
jgi:hypothetical protein